MFVLVVHKTAEATQELIGNRIIEKIVPDGSSRNVEEIKVLPRNKKKN